MAPMAREGGSSFAGRSCNAKVHPRASRRADVTGVFVTYTAVMSRRMAASERPGITLAKRCGALACCFVQIRVARRLRRRRSGGLPDRSGRGTQARPNTKLRCPKNDTAATGNVSKACNSRAGRPDASNTVSVIQLSANTIAYTVMKRRMLPLDRKMSRRELWKLNATPATVAPTSARAGPAPDNTRQAKAA